MQELKVRKDAKYMVLFEFYPKEKEKLDLWRGAIIT